MASPSSKLPGMWHCSRQRVPLGLLGKEEMSLAPDIEHNRAEPHRHVQVGGYGHRSPKISVSLELLHGLEHQWEVPSLGKRKA